MKWICLIICLYCFTSLLRAQPTGNSGIYFNIHDVSDADSFLLSEKMAKQRFGQKQAFRAGDFIIYDRGQKQYGFRKAVYENYPCKEYFWYEENKISIVKNKKEVMNIHFVNLPVNYYFINIRFQKGDYELVFPKETPVWDVAQLFPQKWEGDRNYGYDITPLNWDQYKRTEGKGIDSIRHSIIAAAAPAFPYQSAWEGTCTRSVLLPGMDNERSTVQFLVQCQINNCRLSYIQKEPGENSITVWDGEMVAATGSSFLFRFYNGYSFGTSLNGSTAVTAAPASCFIITSPATRERIKGIRFLTNGIYPGIHRAINAGCDDECCIQTDTIPAVPGTKAALMYQFKQGVYQTAFVKIPGDGRQLRFYFHDWQEQGGAPVLYFTYSNGRLQLVDDTKKGWQDTLELTRNEN